MPTLHWINKEKTLKESKKIPYKLLRENKDFSYGNVDDDGNNNNNNNNIIIKGDNLEVLKSLLPYYSGQVKCIYIDPPYNTGNAFEHYNDNLEHSIWLNMMYPRLQLMRELLAEDGVIFVSIDDKELFNLKSIIDEIFGLNNFMCNIIRNIPDGNNLNKISITHEYVLMYKKNNPPKINVLLKDEENLKIDTRLTKNGNFRSQIKFPAGLKSIFKENKIFNGKIGGKSEPIDIIGEMIFENGILKNDIILDAEWAMSGVLKKLFNGERVFDKKGQEYDLPYFTNTGVPYLNKKRTTGIFRSVQVWKNSNELEKLFGKKVFDYPKTEEMIKDLISLIASPHDLILDSFLGSGTTAAVAHKMNRRYIGIEMGEHCITHVVPRLKKVIDGTDQGGISKSPDVNWKGGGSFKFYELGETIFDEEGKIRKSIDFNTLASHIWFSETGTSSDDNNFIKSIGIDGKTALLGINTNKSNNTNTAYVLLYNGILKDKRPEEGNVLTHKILDYLRGLLGESFDGNIIIYGDSCKLKKDILEKNRIIFKQIPYDVKGK